MLRRWLRTGLAAASAVAVGLSVGPAAAESDTYKIGFLMPLTGGSGKLGNMMMTGASLAIDEINSSGGIAGKTLELIPEDSQGLAKNGIDGYRKLVDVDGTEVIITGWTAVSIAVAPLAEKDEVYLLSGSTASPAVRNASPYFQSTWMYADDAAKQILPYAKNELGVERLGVLTVVSDLGAGISAAVKKDWQELGGELAAEESHQMEEANFRPILLNMIRADADAIYITSSNGKQSAQIVRQARELGFDGYFLSYGAFEDPEILGAGEKANNSYYTSPDYDAASDRPETEAFVEAFKAKYDGAVPNVHQANHYDLVYIIADVLEALDESGVEFNGSNFRKTFMDTYPEYDGAGGHYTFNFEDGSVLRSVLVKTVKNGAFVKVADLN